MNTQDFIEILPVSLLEDHRTLVNELRLLARKLGLDFGWHYLLDLTWLISHLEKIEGVTIMDAGAGLGVMQWYLAEHNARIISVDRGSRADMPLRFRKRYHVKTKNETQPLNGPLKALFNNLKRLPSLAGKLKFIWRELEGAVTFTEAPGQVQVYDCDLAELEAIPSNSIDAIVAVSALEHNQPQALEAVVVELLRCLKPGGKLLATLGAARDQDWFHEPSKGWNYTEDSLRRIFQLSPDAPSNYSQYDGLFFQLKNCAELRDNLAKFYFTSADNGMPWGKWDPQYQIVGVCRMKGY
ncbi:MAG: class I SAM-dependent methyltransferase [Anaerolineales bacterium]|nr:class I SAM-dependent methyltransferase [Anaerolineales bacterium]